MTSQYGALIENIVNNEQTNFMRLGDVHMEQKKYVSTLNFDSSDAVFTLQLPQCTTKLGIIEQSSKTYVDLLFDSSSRDVKELVDLLVAMEEEAAKQLHSRSGEWFEGDSGKMTVQSFEDMFTPVVRYVNRQRSVCVRVHIPTSNRGIKQASTGYDCDVYDKLGKSRLLSDIRTDTQILPLIEVKEIRMTSTSINLHLNLIECMIVKDSDSINKDIEQRVPTRRLHLSSDTTNDDAQVMSPTIGNEEVETGSFVDNGHEEKEIEKNECDDYCNDKGKEKEEELSSGEVTVVNGELLDGQKAVDEVNDDAGISLNEGENNEAEVKENVTLLEDVGIDKMENEKDFLEEIGTLTVDETEPIKLKKPDEVYKDIYKAAISKAKKLRQVALEAYLDAKKIKAKFMLEDIYDSDDDGDENEDDAELEEVTNLTVQ
jgi:hypothetical protein